MDVEAVSRAGTRRPAAPPPVPVRPAQGRLPGIEGLRAVAAGAIVVHHVWLFDGGDRVGADSIFLNLALGVTLFFALSGFLLYRPFAAAIARGGSLPHIGSYLRNRALRIIPAYWAILVVTAFVLQTATLRDADGGLAFGVLDDPLQLLSAAALVHDYDPETVLIGIGPAWSLAVEAVFYLLLPILVVGAALLARRAATRGGRVLALLAPPLLLLLIGLSGKLVAGVVLPSSPGAGWGSDWHSVLERSFWVQADLFAFGMVAAVGFTEMADGRLRLPRGWRVAALVAAVAIVVPCAVTLDGGQLSSQPQNTAVALAAALLVAVVAYPTTGLRRPWLLRVLETRVMVAMGLVSYSVFLWNEQVVRWLTDHGLTRPGWGGLVFNLALAAVVIGALSAASYRFVERPALRLKRRPVRTPSVPVAVQLEAAP